MFELKEFQKRRTEKNRRKEIIEKIIQEKFCEFPD